jgi:AcrR family transcriptional regulator
VVSQDERSQATRAALTRAGRELFARRGYAAVSVNEIAAKAGVTTGALYHQFTGKKELFTAIYEELVAAVWERVLSHREASNEPSLIADCEAYLDACAEPEFFRITADGPAVIGWDRLVEGTRTLIEASLTAARGRGEIGPVPIEPIARMLAAALKEAGVMIATAEDPAAARIKAGDAARQLIRGMLSA